MKALKYVTALFMFALAGSPVLEAQTFIPSGKIEYEVKTNVYKTMGSSIFEDMIKDKIPELMTTYYTLTFDGEKSLYEFEKWSDPQPPAFIKNGQDELKYYFDYSTGLFNKQKYISGTLLNVADTIPKLNWRLANENREIAGFNCRKAYAVLFDSVYVFAFYTEELLTPGGPASFQGLPGTILGITVPRLYMSWVATKVQVTGIDKASIKPLKAKKPITSNELDKLLQNRLSDWYISDDPDTNKELQDQKNQFYWNALL